MSEKNNIQHRAVKGYLKPKTLTLFRGFVCENQISESAAINMIVKDFFSRIPDEKKNSYLSCHSKKVGHNNGGKY